MKDLKWLVCYDVNESRRIIASFRMLISAEEFIEKCIPKETKSKFYILNSETGKTNKP